MDFFRIITNYIDLYWEGLACTLQLTLLSLLVAFGGAALLVFCKLSKVKVLDRFAGFYISFFRGIPLVVQLFLVYFGIAKLTDNSICFTGAQAGVITFGLNSAAYLAESLRGGIEGIDKGQIEAAKALGCRYFHILLFIILPQAIRVVFPSMINTTIKLIKDSSIISQIGVAELFHAGYYTMSETFKTFEALIICMLFYLGIVIVLTLLSNYVEKRLATAY